MNKVLVIGSINMDMVIHTSRVPVLGETVIGSGFSIIPGGKGQNQGVTCARLGCEVKFIGCVGNDIYADTLTENMKNSGVDVAHIRKCDTSSGIAVITVCDGKNHIIIDKGANELVTCDIISENIDLIKWADIVVFQFETSQKTTLYAMKLAKKFNKMVILNPAPMIDFDEEIFEYTDIFIPNQHEAALLLSYEIEDVQTAKKAVLEICSKNVKNVIITLGSKGCVYNDGGEVIHQEILPAKVVDTTAAGDSFVGGICKGICSDFSMNKTVIYATAVSALTVSKAGATPSIPFEIEVTNYMAKMGL